MPRKRKLSKKHKARSISIRQLIDLAFVGVHPRELKPGTPEGDANLRYGWRSMEDVRRSWEEHRDRVTKFCKTNDPQRIPWAEKKFDRKGGTHAAEK